MVVAWWRGGVVMWWCGGVVWCSVVRCGLFSDLWRCGGAHSIGIATCFAFMVLVCLARVLSASTRSAHTRRLLIRHWLEFNSLRDLPMLRAPQPVRDCYHGALCVVCRYWLALIIRCLRLHVHRAYDIWWWCGDVVVW